MPVVLLLLLLALPARAEKVEIAVIPDLQNYVSNYTDDVYVDPVLAAAQLEAMMAFVCTLRPAFAVQVGDLTDSTGGPNGGDADDPDPRGLPMGLEWERLATRYRDRLDSCGVGHIEASGNHDSHIGFEYTLPGGAFLGRPYGHAVLARGGDTEQRAALFSTRLGPICVVTADFVVDAVDRAWVATLMGCGHDYPTICLRHASPELPECTNYPNLVAAIEGHWTSTLGLNAQPITRAGRAPYLYLFHNTQEWRLLGTRGGGYLAVLTIDTAARTISTRAWSPVLLRADPPVGFTFRNASMTLDWCSRFGGPACEPSPALPPAWLYPPTLL